MLNNILFEKYQNESNLDEVISFIENIDTNNNLFFDLEILTYSLCCFGMWDTNVENSNNEDWYKNARLTTKNTIEVQLVTNNIEAYNNFFVDSDIDNLLETASQTDKEIFICSVPGTSFQNKTSFVTVWPYFLKNKNLLMMAHLIDSNSKKSSNEYYWSIHPQFFAINLKLWKSIGKPKFNNKTSDLIEEGCRSAENFHDNYTPLHLKSNNNLIKENLKFSYGSNLINEGLKNNLVFLNLNKTVRNNKKFFYESNPQSVRSLKEDNFKFMSNFYSGWDYVFVKNTERYNNSFDDCVLVTFLEDNKIYKNKLYSNYHELKKELSIDSYASVSSGFIGDWWIYNFNYKNDPICYFDVNSASVFYKKMLIENWKGPEEEDIIDFLTSYAKLEESNIFFNFVNHDPPKNIKIWKEDLKKYFSKINDVWPSKEFSNYIRYVKSSNPLYLCTDMLHSPKFFDKLNLIRNNNYQLIFGSNILENRVLNYQLDFNREKIYQYLDNFFKLMPNKTIYIGSNITNYMSDIKMTNILIKK